jgi:hypothetical protein
MSRRIAIHDPFPGQYETSGAGHFGHKPTDANLFQTVAYYAYTKGPLGLLDPGNVLEGRYWAARVGWKAGSVITTTRAGVIPIIYGILADPDHIREGGWDDSYLGMADDRRRKGGSPLAVGGPIGSAGAWSPSSRAV